MREKKKDIWLSVGSNDWNGRKERRKKYLIKWDKKKKCLDGERMGKCRRDGVAGCGYGRGIGS